MVLEINLQTKDITANLENRVADMWKYHGIVLENTTKLWDGSFRNWNVSVIFVLNIVSYIIWQTCINRFVE